MLGDLGTVTPAASGPATDPDGAPRSTTLLVLPEVGGTDKMYGDGSADRMWGGYAADLMEGGPGDDYLEGNDGADTLRGFNSLVDASPPDNSGGVCDPTADNDDIIGGSSSANPDTTKRDVGETLIQGNCGFDVILGDNGQLTRTPSADNLTWVQDVVQKGPARTIFLDDTSRTLAELPQVSGGDVIEGNAGNDKAFGEGGNDTIRGNDGNDVLVGNQDSDVINGNDGEDDVIGGSLGSATGPGLVGKGQLDAGDRLYGDAQQDVITGDNAQVLRPFTGLAWDLDPITGGHQRTVTLWDTELTTGGLLTVSGNDLALGGAGSDRIFGEGGNDTLKGNADDDFVQGNQGGDLIEGNGGEDDLVGGSRTAGQLDGDDIIHGGGDADVAIGDNGLIDRAPLNTNGPYDYVTYQIGQTAKRSVKLFDIDSTNPDIAGGDQVAGGQGVDVLFGQGENDFVFGGTEDDYLEGNAATDFEFGDLNPDQVGVGNPPQLATGLPALPPGLPVEDGATAPKSPQPELDGPPGAQGQDDLIGGSSTANRTDANDFQYGNGAADFILGDNGQLTRTITSGDYTHYATYNPTTIQRTVVRFCTTAANAATCEASGRSGGDYQEGNAGDDYIWGQDGNDTQLGGTENDDMYGELGDDRMFGEDGEDAMVGDRGGITDTLLTNAQPLVNDTTQGPAFFDYHAMEKGQLDRRVAMNKDFGGGALPHPGMTDGGADYMSGGRGHDSMHGEANDDVMNGDSGGDYVFGDDGGDALWGGKGSDNPATPNAVQENTGPNAAVGITRNNLLDIVFGGYGGSSASPGGQITGGSDVIDWRPRPGTDPASWLAITHTDNDTSDPATTLDNQHHQGLDWIYGGWDRDVMQGDVGKNGPDFGDRLMDWVGAYNLYSRCNASYGDDGDLRQVSPDAQAFIQNLAYGSGAGATLGEVQTATASGGREMALVYQSDIKDNNGKAYPTTPGHFDNPFCNGS
jgi:Ca2+-binding RTX toxin-like protein